jgi:hypothetical protein
MASYTISISKEDMKLLKKEMKTRDSFEAIRRAVQKVIETEKIGGEIK